MPFEFEIDIQQLGLHRVTVDVSPVVVPPPPPPVTGPAVSGLLAATNGAMQSITLPRSVFPYLQGSLLVRFQLTEIPTEKKQLAGAVPLNTQLPGFSLGVDVDGKPYGTASLAFDAGLGAIVPYEVKGEEVLVVGQFYTLAVVWDPDWMYLFLDGVEVARFNKGTHLDQITEQDYFGPSLPDDPLAVALSAEVTHSVLAGATWTPAEVVTAHEWTGGATPPPPPPPPTALTVDAGPDQSVDQLGVTFSPVITGGVAPLSQLWDYGDGTTGAENTHSYAGDGVFPAVLTVTDASGNPPVSDTVQVTVALVPLPPPVEGFLVTPHDTIQDFGISPTVQSVASGDWSNPANWSTGVVPGTGDVVKIAVGHTVTYDLVSDVPLETVAIAGTLKAHRTLTTKLLVRNLLTYEGGTRDWGTQADPVTASLTEVVFRDVAPTDPGLYGTGEICLGTATSWGKTKSYGPRQLAAEALQGHTTLTLALPVVGWEPGDRLLLGDHRQLDYFQTDANYVWEGERPTIQSVSPDGRTITLTSPLTRNHYAIREVGTLDAEGALQRNGTVVDYLYVGNLTHNVIFRSENPSGTRAHFMITHEAPLPKLGYTEFRGTGRTTNAELDPVTNHVGRYPIHIHHLHGAGTETNPRAVLEGCSAWCPLPMGVVGFKWPITVHDTKGVVIRGCVTHNWAGSHITTEEDTETDCVIEDNFCVLGRGSHGPTVNVGTGHDTPGGVWVAHPHNRVRRNVCANFPEGTGWIWFPKQSSALNNFAIREDIGNVAYGCKDGLHLWNLGTSAIGASPPNQPKSLIENARIYNVLQLAIYPYNLNNVEVLNPIVRGDWLVAGPNSQAGFFASGDYVVTDLVVRGADVRGLMSFGTVGNLTEGSQLFEDCFIDCYSGVAIGSLSSSTPDGVGPGSPPPRRQLFRNVRFGTTGVQLGGERRDYDLSWSLVHTNAIQLDEVIVENHDGTGLNYRIYHNEQKPGEIAFHTVDDPAGKILGVPVAGLTNAEAWATYGLANGGAVAPADAVEVPWVVGGVAKQTN